MSKAKKKEFSADKKTIKVQKSNKEAAGVLKTWAVQPRVQTSTPLNVFGITLIVRSRKCNQRLRLNFEGAEKYSYTYEAPL